MAASNPRVLPAIAAKIPSRYALAMTNKTITRTDLVATLNAEVGLSKTECAGLLEGVLKEIAAKFSGISFQLSASHLAVGG